jgi:hypothetical protein
MKIDFFLTFLSFIICTHSFNKLEKNNNFATHFSWHSQILEIIFKLIFYQILKNNLLFNYLFSVKTIYIVLKKLFFDQQTRLNFDIIIIRFGVNDRVVWAIVKSAQRSSNLVIFLSNEGRKYLIKTQQRAT